MKKTFKFYTIGWAVLFVLFNIIAFVSVGWKGVEKYTPSFWIGYSFITIMFIGHIICAYFALKDREPPKTFYNISLGAISFTGSIISFIVGGLCMIISPLPYWVGIILCTLVLVFNVVSVAMSTVSISAVCEIDKKVKESTFYIKSLTADAENLMAHAKSEGVKAECKKVYEAVRYSDPMSNNALGSIEGEIALMFARFSEAVKEDNLDGASALSREVIILIGDRNKRCKLLK